MGEENKKKTKKFSAELKPSMLEDGVEIEFFDNNHIFLGKINLLENGKVLVSTCYSSHVIEFRTPLEFFFKVFIDS